MEPRKRILVVDDSEDIRELYEIILRAEGYEVRSAATGERGFAEARRWRPDLVLLDVVMPGMDGLELLLKLRSDLATPIPPVIVCSGFDLTEEEALRRGAVRFLRKPTEDSDLLEAVAEAVRGEAPAPESERRQRDHATVARQRTLETASELMRRIEAHAGVPVDTLDVLAQAKIETIAAYIGIARAAMALVQDRRLVVRAATDDAALPREFDLGAAIPEAYEVLETGSALLLPDASARPFEAVARSLGGIRFFGGVPLRVGASPVGVICMFDPAVRHFEAEELVALELFGRRGSDVLMRFAENGESGTAGRYGRGIVVREMFDALLDAELRILERCGGSMEVAVIDVPSLAGVAAAVEHAPAPTRLIAGVLSSGRVALFKRADDESARAQLTAVIDDLHAAAEPSSVGFVELPRGGVHGFSGRELVHVASIALDRAEDRGDGMHRVIIAEEHAGASRPQPLP